MKTAVFLIVLILSGLAVQGAAAQVSLTYAPPCLVPGDIVNCPSEVGGSVANYLLRFYNFSIGIVGTIAFGMIVYGGLLIAFSGVADKKKEGKEAITAALWGIAILLGSYLILNTVNPAIPQLREPTITQITREQLELSLPTIGGGNLLACGQLNKNNTPTNPENVCGPNEWPFVAVINNNVSDARNPQRGSQPGWDCKDPFGNHNDGPGDTQWRACAPSTGLSGFPLNNSTKRAFFAFSVDGIREFKSKAMVNFENTADLISIEGRASLNIKNNGGCRIGPDNQMMDCVCIWNVNSTGNRSCRVKPAVSRNLDFISRLYAANGISWQITEAYPPTIMHSESCHFDGSCVDIGILRQDQNCAVVDQAISLAKNAGFLVINEYPACRGQSTNYATGGHLHLSL